MHRNEKFKIVISSFGYVNGPGYQRTFKIAVGLVKLGHEVIFLTSQKNFGKFPYSVRMRNGVKEVAFFDPFPRRFKKLGLTIIAPLGKTIYLMNKSYDILHSDAGHRLTSGIPCWLTKLFSKSIYISEWWDFYGKGGHYDSKPFIWKYTYGLLDNYLERLDKKIADGVICLSKFTLNRVKKLNKRIDQTTIIYGGSDINDIQYVPDKRFRKNYKLNDDDFVIVMVDISKKEDFGPLLEIIPVLSKKINLKVVTTGSYLDLNNLATNVKENHIFQLGWIDYEDYYKLLSLADIFFLYQPRDKVTMAKWPNKIGDYLCAGRIIITNPINDIDQLADRNNAAIFKCEDNAKKLKSLLISLYSRRNELMKLGYHNKLISEDLSWQNKAQEVSSFYRQIIETKRKY